MSAQPTTHARQPRSATAQLPALFHLQPIGDFRDLPLGSEFDVVYCPEASTGDGWVIIRFRTVDYYRRPQKDWVRVIQQLSKTAISEDEAALLWADVCEGVTV